MCKTKYVLSTLPFYLCILVIIPMVYKTEPSHIQIVRETKIHLNSSRMYTVLKKWKRMTIVYDISISTYSKIHTYNKRYPKIYRLKSSMKQIDLNYSQKQSEDERLQVYICNVIHIPEGELGEFDAVFDWAAYTAINTKERQK